MGPGFRPEFGCGALPARRVWQGSGFTADQTNAMLAVVRADDESLVPPQAAGLALSVARPLPTETASLGFGGSPVGGGDKNSRFAFSAFPCGGWYHYPRRAFHAVETLDTQRAWRRIRRFYAAPEFALCGLNIPSAGTHATPAPNRAHSGSRGETRRVIRVDGDDALGRGSIDPIGPFQADQTVAVAFAEGHRNAVSP